MANDNNIFGIPVPSGTANAARGQLLDAMNQGTLFGGDRSGTTKQVPMTVIGFFISGVVVAIVFGIVVGILCFPSREITNTIYQQCPIPSVSQASALFANPDSGKYYEYNTSTVNGYLLEAAKYNQAAQREYVIKYDKFGNRYSYYKGGN